jgi:apolipoprotein N-acyltransferase
MKNYRWIFGSICLIIGAVIGWIMIQRNGQHQLWGFLPLFLFLAVWMAQITFLLGKWTEKKIRNLLLSTGAGLALSFGFPPMPFFPLLLVGLVPLLIILDDEDITKKERFWLFMNAFIIWNTISTYWVANTSFFPGIVAISLNSLFMTTVLILYRTIKRHMSDHIHFWILASFWISFEYLHLFWDISWPWLTLGNGLSGFAWLPQWYEYTGVFGGTLWIVGINYLFFRWIRRGSEREPKFMIGALALSIIPIALSICIYNFKTIESSDSLNVLTVQPNLEPHYQKFNSQINYLDQYQKLIQNSITEETELILLPETSLGNFGPLDINSIDSHRDVKRMKDVIRTYENAELLTGVLNFQVMQDNSSPNIRMQISNGDTVWYEIQNSALQFSGNHPDYQHYIKSKLVPGAEFFPFRKFLPFIKPIINMLDGTVEGWGTQREREVFEINGKKVGPIICYESIYGGYVGGYVRKGAQVLAVLTNDGWWDNTSGHIQHAYLSRLSAIEQRKSVVRSANMGTTCWINPLGQIHGQNNYGEEHALNVNVPLNNIHTIYLKWGDIIARISVFTALLFLINGFVKGRLKK